MFHNHWILTNLTISLKDPSDRIHLDYLNLQSVSMNLLILILLISIEVLYINNFRLGLILLEMLANVILPENGPIWQQLRDGNLDISFIRLRFWQLLSTAVCLASHCIVFSKSMDALLTILQSKQKILILVGAGISKSAGFPSFVSSKGSYGAKKKDLFDANVTNYLDLNRMAAEFNERKEKALGIHQCH